MMELAPGPALRSEQHVLYIEEGLPRIGERRWRLTQTPYDLRAIPIVGRFCETPSIQVGTALRAVRETACDYDDPVATGRHLGDTATTERLVRCVDRAFPRADRFYLTFSCRVFARCSIQFGPTQFRREVCQHLPQRLTV